MWLAFQLCNRYRTRSADYAQTRGDTQVIETPVVENPLLS